MTSKKEKQDKPKPSTSQEIKKAFEKLAKHNLDQLQHDIDSLSPKDRLSFLLHFYEYILPKLSRTKEKEQTTESPLRTWVITPVQPYHPDEDEAKL